MREFNEMYVDLFLFGSKAMLRCSSLFRLRDRDCFSLFLRLFRQQVLELIDKQIYQSWMHLTDDKGLAVFLAYRNLSCPMLVFSVIPSVMEIVLYRVCQHILNALFGKLLKDRFDCNSRRKSVIDMNALIN